MAEQYRKILDYLQTEKKITRAAILSIVTFASALICFMAMVFVVPNQDLSTIYLIIGFWFLFLTWKFSEIDHKTRMKDLLRIPEKNSKKT